jgi:serine/threonine-protein kinase
MDGGTLRERLTKERQLPIGIAVEIARAMATALEHAHAQGIIHRDVKPENILFAGDEARLADFGIARVLDDAVGWTTTTGMVRGTPTYMSPEQAAGERRLDGRSDVYALGIVLYEMLAGVAPFAAATPQATIAQRFTHPPEALTRYRPTVPAELEEIVRIALATAAADRFASARAFAEALGGIGSLHSGSAAAAPLTTDQRRSRPTRVARGTRARLTSAALVVTAAAGAAFYGRHLRPARHTAASVDTTILLVLPPEPASGENDTSVVRTTERLYDAFRRWHGLSLVDRFLADSAIRSEQGAASERPAELALSLGAGRYVRTRLTRIGDSLSVYQALYDVRYSAPLYQTTQYTRGTFDRVVDSVLFRGASLSGTLVGTSSLQAAQAMGRAGRALQSWDLSGADSALQEARERDPTSARIDYWSAQVRAWKGDSPSRWRELAGAGARDTNALPAGERTLAVALSALGQDRFEDACAQYARARAARPNAFAGWYGIAQCHDLDRIVLRDPRSPSGWRFRSSYWQAMLGYEQALIREPRAFRMLRDRGFEQLRNRFFVSSTRMRAGRTAPTLGAEQDVLRFSAHPSVAGDSLVFVPFPSNDVRAAVAGISPRNLARAVRVGRSAVRRITEAWAGEYPHDPEVKEAVAVSLELLGDPSAADTLRIARQTERDELRRAQMAAAEVMVRVKFALPGRPDQLTLATVLADSLLRSGDTRSAEVAAILAPLAALLGNCELAERFTSASAPAALNARLDRALIRDVSAYGIRTAMGCPQDAAQPTLETVWRELPRKGGVPDRSAVALLSRALSLEASPDTAYLDRVLDAGDDYVLRAWRGLKRGDRESARAILRRAAAERVASGDASATPDASLAEARIWLTLGDTAAAAAVMDASLDALRDMNPGALNDPIVAASLRRLAFLRLELLRDTGPEFLVRRWTTALNSLSPASGRRLASGRTDQE